MSVHFSKYIGFYIAAVLAVIIFMPGSPPLFVDNSKPQNSSVVKFSVLATRCPTGQEWTNAVVSKSLRINESRLAALKAARSLNNKEICTIPEAKLAKAFSRLDQPKTDQPGEWAKFRAMQQSDESGVVKPDGLSVAIKQRLTIVEQDKLMGYARRGGISQDKWESIGPGNVGGRIRSIVIHPDQPEKMWVGSVSGGIWHTTNGGKSWDAVNDFMGNLSITSIVMDPNDSSVMYAATGEGFFAYYIGKGAGIFKTTDGGNSWKQLPSTSPGKSTDWEYVNRVAIHPLKSNILLAATRGGLFRSVDFGISWKKTIDSYGFLDVKFSTDAEGAVAFGRKYNQGKDELEYRNFYGKNDGGNWNVSPEIHQGRIEYAFSASKPSYVYASIDNHKEIKTSDGSVIELHGEIYRSTNYGETWKLLPPFNNLGNQGWYDNAIWVDPTDHKHIIVGGLDLFRTTNEGGEWTKISEWRDRNSIHADHHAIVSHPSYGIDNKTVFFGNDGGIYKISNIDAYNKVENLNNGLAITQFYGGAGHNGKNGRIVGGTQDNGTPLYTGEKNKWVSLFGGDGGNVAINPDDGRYIYGETQRLGVFQSFDGVTGSWMCKGVADAEPKYRGSELVCGVKDGKNKSNFIAPLTLDPNDSRYLYAGGASLWRTNGAGSKSYKWTSIKSPIRDDWYGYISKITIAKGNMYKIWVGHNNGALYLTRHGREAKPDWQRIGEGQLPKRMILDVLVDNKQSSRIYVSFGGYSKDNLYMSADDGQTWQDISGNLPESPIRTIQQHPNRPDWLYVGTEVGIFTSEDGGLSWTSNNDGPANVAVDQLFWLDKATLVAATHGRGMFKATVANGVSSLAAPVIGTHPRSVISYTNPTYYWKPIDGVDSYEIAIIKGDQLLFSKVIAAKDISCYTSCGSKPGKVLAAGNYRWRIRARLGSQVSVWNEKVFKIDPTQRAATAILNSPNNTDTTTMPVYKWKAANKATLYYLRVVENSLNNGNGAVVFDVWILAKNAGCDKGGVCSLTSKVKLKGGVHRWGVLSANSTGTSNWSQFSKFTVRDLVAPEIASPTNTISYTNPTYFWKPVAGAEKYDLIVSKADGKWVFRKVISVKDANCSADYCRFFPDKTLVAGSYKTMLRTQGGTQFSAWNKVSFKVDPSLKPGATILISPDGTINTRTPTYKWKAAAKATQYRLWVSDDTFSGESSANVYNNWFTAEALGCKQGGTCSIKPPGKISRGPHRWWVKSWNATGSGDWSKNKNFVISNTAN